MIEHCDPLRTACQLNQEKFENSGLTPSVPNSFLPVAGNKVRMKRKNAIEQGNPDSRRDWLALFCALTAVSIWGWWMSATRVAATDGIAPLDVALLRYSIPALLLVPVWLATIRKLLIAPIWSLIAMLGWGVPFLWLVTASLRDSEVIYMATIVPCTMPIFAVLAERLFFGNRMTTNQKIGFTLIAMAALLVLFNALRDTSGVSIDSIGFMLLAAIGWSAYVVAFRHTGLTAAEGAAWVCTASTIIILLSKLCIGGALLPLKTDQLVFHAFAQGFLSGFVAVILYTTAIERLGPARAASFSVLMPVLGVMFAWIWLNESPSGSNMIALLLGTAGVAVVNGLVSKSR